MYQYRQITLQPTFQLFFFLRQMYQFLKVKILSLHLVREISIMLALYEVL